MDESGESPLLVTVVTDCSPEPERGELPLRYGALVR
jgi:hypothetical protein